MAFVIKNVRDHVIHVDGVPINPGQQLTVQNITGPINKALDNGDLRLYDGDETREERHATAEAFQPFDSDDKDI